VGASAGPKDHDLLMPDPMGSDFVYNIIDIVVKVYVFSPYLTIHDLT
jgi:hypothetical protein